MLAILSLHGDALLHILHVIVRVLSGHHLHLIILVVIMILLLNFEHGMVNVTINVLLCQSDLLAINDLDLLLSPNLERDCLLCCRTVRVVQSHVPASVNLNFHMLSSWQDHNGGDSCESFTNL